MTEPMLGMKCDLGHQIVLDALLDVAPDPLFRLVLGPATGKHEHDEDED
jgi:hypothetical protein